MAQIYRHDGMGMVKKLVMLHIGRDHDVGTCICGNRYVFSTGTSAYRHAFYCFVLGGYTGAACYLCVAYLLDFTDEFYSRNRVGEISYNAEADFASAGFVATVVKSVRIRKTELFGKMP